MKLSLVFLLFSSIAFSQVDESEKIMTEAKAAFLNNDFEQAKKLYKEVTDIKPKNKDAWYNLAATELKLNEVENACESFYKVYLLKDQSVVKELKEFCPNFRDSSIKSMSDLDEKPKFILKDKEYELFQGDVFNPIYLKLLQKELKKSSILKSKLDGNSIIQFTINKYGVFEIAFLRIDAKSEDYIIIENELKSIFRRIAKYTPARFDGKDVDIWEKWILPIRN